MKINWLLLFDRVTGASCAMKEVDIIPGDPKSAESVKQLEQVIFGVPYRHFSNFNSPYSTLSLQILRTNAEATSNQIDWDFIFAACRKLEFYVI